MAASKIRDAEKLIERVRKVGQRLVTAQPREMAVGNIVRRVLGVIREVAEDDPEALNGDEEVSVPSRQRPTLSSGISTFSPLNHSAAIPHEMPMRPDSSASSDVSMSGRATPDLSQRPQLLGHASYIGPQQATTLFGLFSQPELRSPIATPPSGTQSPVPRGAMSRRATGNATQIDQKIDIKAEVIDGIRELQDELEVVDSQIAESALDHIHSNEIILTHTSSQTVQKFLMTAARKRKFTVIHAEAYPNDHEETHATIVHGKKRGGDDEEADDRWKPLTAMGITVILIPDTAVFALMSRINKVVLAPHTVLANGSLIAASGALTIAQAANVHRVPVVVLSGVYKLSPVYPFDMEELIEFGDPGKVIPFHEGDMVDGVDVTNPIFDYVSADLIDLYITNL